MFSFWSMPGDNSNKTIEVNIKLRKDDRENFLENQGSSAWVEDLATLNSSKL